MSVTVRFAPSPTGFLHIGGARTALFNWLFAKHHGGTFRLRIEDTDRARSTQEAVDAIIDGMRWLEPRLGWRDRLPIRSAPRATPRSRASFLPRARPIIASARRPSSTRCARRHAPSAARCATTARWRDRDPKTAPQGVPPVIRLKAPQTGETVIEDRVQGRVTVANEQLDDLIILRADGTPTYNLSVVVDDHDMGITHVIRGDDHFNNAFRQTQIYRALGWDVPVFAHVPLIHGPDGAKLSKRHGALGVDAYRDMGYLPAALRNYLLRLGWSHGDDEIISTAEAIEWFELDAVGRAPARFDFTKLANLNGHYIRETDDRQLVALAAPFIERALSRPLSDSERERLAAAMPGLKPRAKTLVELGEHRAFLCRAAPDPGR